MSIIEFKNVWEMYKIKFIIGGKTSWDNFWAIKDMSFSIEKGEVVGIIGENGAGKTTALKMISGMLKPDRGQVSVLGKVSGLMELGAGLERELPGKENIYLCGNLFGLTRKQVDEKYKMIEDFADLGRFVNAPVKCYSQGMFVRLAFSIAIHMDPDILVVDDILTVGDEFFQRKCIKKIFRLKEQGKTIVVATHDMNMLSKLCQKVFLFKNGKILKTGAPKDVIPTYTQTLGPKHGVGVLKKGPLGVVFNNGTIFLDWKGHQITSASGLFTVFKIAARFYNSSQAEWFLEEQNDTTIVAKGKFYSIDCEQVWKIKIEREKEICFECSFKADAFFETKEMIVNLALNQKYKNWRVNSEKGSFPEIAESVKHDYPLVENDASCNYIGVESAGALEEIVPSVIFEKAETQTRSFGQVLNSSYLLNSRILRYKIEGLENYLSENNNSGACLSSKLIFDVKDVPAHINKLEKAHALQNKELEVSFKSGQGVLFYKGKQLTSGSHMSLDVSIAGRWYSSCVASWEIEKKSETLLVARGRWQSLSIVQEWELEIDKNETLQWRVSFDVPEKQKIDEVRAQITCSREYCHWFSDYGRGSFPEKFLEIENDLLQRCVPDGKIGVDSGNQDLPALALGFDEKENVYAKVFNSDFYHKARILRIDNVPAGKEIVLSPGKNKVFNLDVQIGENKEEGFLVETRNKIEKDPYVFLLDRGKGVLSYKSKPVTKGLGFYTSFRVSGKWHDSHSAALWKIPLASDNKIEALGQWRRLPIEQRWSLLFEKDQIDISIVLILKEDVCFERMQTNLMVSQEHIKWEAGESMGEFPAFKKDIKDDWQCLWAGGQTSTLISAMTQAGKGQTQKISLCLKKEIEEMSLKIVNSDMCHRGRVLQYGCSGEREFLKGEYSVFEGTIKVQ